MRKIAAILVMALFGLAILTQPARAEQKFAYVDLSRLFSEYGKTKDFDKTLSEKESTYTAEREKKVNDVKQFQDKINLLSEKEKAEKKTELENKVKALNDFDRDKQTDLKKEQDEKMREILKDIEEAVKKYSEKEGFTMVFNDRVLVYQDKTLDITEKVMEILNKGYKK